MIAQTFLIHSRSLLQSCRFADCKWSIFVRNMAWCVYCVRAVKSVLIYRFLTCVWLRAKACPHSLPCLALLQAPPSLRKGHPWNHPGQQICLLKFNLPYSHHSASHTAIALLVAAFKLPSMLHSFLKVLTIQENFKEVIPLQAASFLPPLPECSGAVLYYLFAL